SWGFRSKIIESCSGDFNTKPKQINKKYIYLTIKYVTWWILRKLICAAFFGAVGNYRYSEILEREAISDGPNMKNQYHSNKPTVYNMNILFCHHNKRWRRPITVHQYISNESHIKGIVFYC
ncbi:adenosine kinase-like, partial [Aphis craccivora]